MQESETNDRDLNKFEMRFYEKQYPEENELVMVQIKDVNEYATIVKLLEYDSIEGIITPNEYTRASRVKNVMKVRKIGKEEICMVVRVDKENGYIDLSKKRVLTAEIPDATEKFVKGKTVQAIMRSVHEATGATLKDLYEKIVWPLQTDGSLCFDKFIRHINNPDALLNKLEGVSNEVKSKLRSDLVRRLMPQPVKICAVFELTCFAIGGINSIKEALTEGEKCSTKDIQLNVSLNAPPEY